MEKHVKKVKQSLQKSIKLDRAVVKPGQAILLENFTKNNSAVFYRQVENLSSILKFKTLLFLTLT